MLLSGALKHQIELQFVVLRSDLFGSDNLRLYYNVLIPITNGFWFLSIEAFLI